MTHVVRIVAPAKSRNPTSLAEVRAQLRMAAGDASRDPELKSLIAMVGRVFERELGRPWARATYQVEMAGRGGRFLRLPVWPLEALPAVELRGTLLDDDTYTLESEPDDPERVSLLYRVDGWEETPRDLGRYQAAGRQELPYSVGPVVGGWLAPDLITTWTAATVASLGAWVRPVNLSLSTRLECTTAGTTGPTEPTWPSTVGGTVTDGTAVWTLRAARELPSDLQLAATYAVGQWASRAVAQPEGVKRDRVGPVETEYFEVRDETPALPRVCLGILEAYQ